MMKFLWSPVNPYGSPVKSYEIPVLVGFSSPYSLLLTFPNCTSGSSQCRCEGGHDRAAGSLATASDCESLVGWLILGEYTNQYMEVSYNRGTPIGWFTMENPTKMDDFGVAVF